MIDYEQEGYPCPACGFLMFDRQYSHQICSICNWQDDDVQLRFPMMRGGANHKSLYEWQQDVMVRLPLDVQAYNDEKRDPLWRPLKLDELQDSDNAPTNALEYFFQLEANKVNYYWLNDDKGSEE